MNVNYKIKDKTKPIDSIKVAPFKKNIRTTTAHKHNSYFEIIYLTNGTGIHIIDTQEYVIEPPIVFTVRKEQVHFWNIDSEPTGYVLIIKKDYVTKTLDKEIGVLVSKLSDSSCLFPQDKAIDDLFKMLNKEYENNTLENNPIFDGLLKALLGKLLQSNKPVFQIKNERDYIFKSYKELLTQENKLVNSVAHYAETLNTTPQNLNAVCRKEKDQSASEILSDFIISEAKRLLIYTNLTISEISNSFGFKDNSHFTKYFKRQTNVTPNAFRKDML